MRKLALFAVGLAVAVFTAVYLAPEGAWLWLAGCCAALAGISAVWKEKRRVTIVVLGLAVGFFWSWGYDAVFLTPARLLDGEVRPIAATVTDWPWETAYGAAVPVRISLTGGKAILYADADLASLKPGDEVRGPVLLRAANREEGQYLRAKGVFLRAYAKGELAVASAPKIPIRYWPKVAAKAIKEKIAQLFPPDTAGFMAALITGDKAEIGEALDAAFARTGLAHVVAVSGLHVSFLAGLLALFLGKGRFSAGVTIGLLLFFAATVGNSPSVLRAVYLQGALLLAPILGRENDQPTSLAAALMLLLMWNPWAAADVGLQLSFGAVAGIYLITGPLHHRWTDKLKDGFLHKLARFTLGSLATSLGALLFTTPLMAYYFGTISLIAPLANLLTLWAASWAFFGGILAAVAGFLVPAAGVALAWAAAWLVRFVQWAALILAKIPFAAVPSGGYFGLWLGFAYVLLVIWALWRGEKRRPLIAVGACVLTLCTALLLNVLTLRGGDLRVAVLDVGQGGSVLFTSDGKRALVDCGGNGSRNAGDVAADAVQSSGSATLDYLVLTHFHADHANGVERLMARLDVKTVLVPDAQPDEPMRAKILALAQEEGAEVRFIKKDETLLLGGTALTLYAPLGDGGANEEGLSILATCGDFDALVTGDMNAAVEKRLVNYGNLPDIELLVVGHHGSNYSSSEALLLASKPEYAVISVGENRYGHPADGALERLAAAGCEIYRTDQMGTVTITANKE